MREPEQKDGADVIMPAEQQQPSIPRPVQDALGERLRTMYDAIKAEPVPDRLLALLQQIEQRPSKA